MPGLEAPLGAELRDSNQINNQLWTCKRSIFGYKCTAVFHKNLYFKADYAKGFKRNNQLWTCKRSIFCFIILLLCFIYMRPGFSTDYVKSFEVSAACNCQEFSAEVFYRMRLPILSKTSFASYEMHDKLQSYYSIFH